MPDKLSKTEGIFDYEGSTMDSKKSRKRSNSLSESASSADESCNSGGYDISSSSLSGTSSPATSAHDYSPNGYDEPNRIRSTAPFNTVTDSHLANELDPVSLSHISAATLALQHYPTEMPTMLEAFQLRQSLSYLEKTPMDLMRTVYQPHSVMPHCSTILSSEYEQSRKIAAIASPPKKTGFSISAILGCES